MVCNLLVFSAKDREETNPGNKEYGRAAAAVAAGEM